MANPTLEMRPRSNTKVEGSIVSFHDVNYKVKVKKQQKNILINVSGLFKPGMNAILGPTGSGKTSLLDILARRKDPSGLAGEVLVDGQSQPDNFQCVSGYVVQDDVVMGTLSVRENLMFSANLRLPKSIGQAAKKERVEETISNLGLEHCADTKVGTPLIRGVSGGERKRTNIGMELVTSPKVLFLDEPTTGLDASTAGAVMALVQQLSRQGRTVIFSIHQPRYSIFRLIDNLMLLAAGKTVYHGPASEAVNHFSHIGYSCEAFNNPPDFFLDVINGDSTAVKGQNIDAKSTTSRAMTNPSYRKIADNVSNDQPKNGISVSIAFDEQPQELSTKLANYYESSEISKSTKEELDDIFKRFSSPSEQEDRNLKQPKYGYATPFLSQLGWVSKRTFQNLIRNPALLFMQAGTVVVFALLVGVIYFQISDIMPEALQNIVGALFFIVMNQLFANMSAIELFIVERKIFMHENISGFYRVSAYFISKVFCDIIPLRLVPVILFSCISYFMIGFVTDVAKFFIYMLILFLTTFAASGMAFFFSSVVDITGVANLLTALSFVLMMLFGGLLVQINSIVVWLRWLQYLSIIRYSYNALLINQLVDLEFCQISNNTKTCSNTIGNQYLEAQGIAYTTEWDLWQNMVALFCIAMGFMIITYLRLRFVKKYT